MRVYPELQRTCVHAYIHVCVRARVLQAHPEGRGDEHTAEGVNGFGQERATRPQHTPFERVDEWKGCTNGG